MAKKKYSSPILLDGLDPVDDPTIVIGGSQGTSGEDSQFTWDPEIAESDFDMFWLNYDETDLAFIDTDKDQFISKTEFDAWLKSIGGW